MPNGGDYAPSLTVDVYLGSQRRAAAQDEALRQQRTQMMMNFLRANRVQPTPPPPNLQIRQPVTSTFSPDTPPWMVAGSLCVSQTAVSRRILDRWMGLERKGAPLRMMISNAPRGRRSMYRT